MTNEKLIAVVGATGSQGGGLVRAILEDPDHEFRVRALTRSAGSEKARELADAGAEVVEADLDDGPSMRRAFEGADGAFVVTNYWAERTPEEEAARTRAAMELAQADIAALAAKQAGVGHVIWSTLEDTRDFFGEPTDGVPDVDGAYKVPHFDAKAEADALFREYDVPTTFLRTTFFFEGFAGGLGPVRGDDGTLVLTLPMADQMMSGIAVGDIGRTALGVFRRGHGARRRDGQHRRRSPHRRAVRGGPGRRPRRRGSLPAARLGRIPRSGLPRRRRDGQHVPVLRPELGPLRRRPRPVRGAGAQPRTAVVPRLACLAGQRIRAQ